MYLRCSWDLMFTILSRSPYGVVLGRFISDLIANCIVLDVSFHTKLQASSETRNSRNFLFFFIIMRSHKHLPEFR